MRVTQVEVTFLESRPVSMKKEAMHALPVKKEAMHARTHASDISENPSDSGSQNCIEYYLPTPRQVKQPCRLAREYLLHIMINGRGSG